MPNESDYYGADPAADAAAPPDPKSKTPDPKKEPEAETALLPKSLFPGEPPAVGDLCQFKIEHVWEDEIEVSYQKEGMEKSSRGPSAMDTATDSFDQMAAPAATPE
jgi:hypothetical protein